MANVWYYYDKNNVKQGPFTSAELKQYVLAGEVKRSTRILKVNAEDEKSVRIIADILAEEVPDLQFEPNVMYHAATNLKERLEFWDAVFIFPVLFVTIFTFGIGLLFLAPYFIFANYVRYFASALRDYAVRVEVQEDLSRQQLELLTEIRDLLRKRDGEDGF